MFSDQQGSGIATSGVFTYFFWVLLQPFRGNPEYKDVADLPYNSSCLTRIATDQTDIKSLGNGVISSQTCLIAFFSDMIIYNTIKKISICVQSLLMLFLLLLLLLLIVVVFTAIVSILL